MEYVTTCYRRQGESGCSLLLLQYLCRQTPVCFACICTVEGAGNVRMCGNMAEKLKTWCHSVPWHRAARCPCRWLVKLEKELSDLTADRTAVREEMAAAGQTAMDGQMAATGGIRLTLLLCIGREILVLGDGQNLMLVNTSLGAGRVTPLQGSFRGAIEPGAGLLLATDGFMKSVGEQNLREVLCLPEIRTKEQADRRLGELLNLNFREFSFPWKCGGAEKAAENNVLGERTEEKEEPIAAVLLIGREGKAGVYRQ